MTAPPLADRGLLSALAIQYDKAGLRDRPARLQHASTHVGRDITSSAELSAQEARDLRRHLPRCGQGCAVATTAEPAPTPAEAGCPCTTGGRSGTPSPCDPTGSGRYCPPRACYCGHCPWWTPAPPVDYAAARRSLGKKWLSWDERNESTWIDEL